MGKVKTEDLKPGMVVESDVLDLDGRTLFTIGTTLSERSIEILQSWGIQLVDIEGQEETEIPLEERFSPKILEQAEQETTDKFRFVESDHPVVLTVRHLSLVRRATELQKHEDASRS